MVDREVILSVVAIFVYIVGGIGTFCGAGLILLMRGKDLWGTGGGAYSGLPVCLCWSCDDDPRCVDHEDTAKPYIANSF